MRNYHLISMEVDLLFIISTCQNSHKFRPKRSISTVIRHILTFGLQSACRDAFFRREEKRILNESPSYLHNKSTTSIFPIQKTIFF